MPRYVNIAVIGSAREAENLCAWLQAEGIDARVLTKSALQVPEGCEAAARAVFAAGDPPFRVLTAAEAEALGVRPVLVGAATNSG